MLTRFMYYKTTDKRHLIYKYTITRSPSSSCSPSKSSKSSSPPSTNSSPFPSQVLHYQAYFSNTKLIILCHLISSKLTSTSSSTLSNSSHSTCSPIILFTCSNYHSLDKTFNMLSYHTLHLLQLSFFRQIFNLHFHAKVLQVQCFSSLLPWGVLRP